MASEYVCKLNEFPHKYDINHLVGLCGILGCCASLCLTQNLPPLSSSAFDTVTVSVTNYKGTVLWIVNFSLSSFCSIHHQRNTWSYYSSLLTGGWRQGTPETLYLLVVAVLLVSALQEHPLRPLQPLLGLDIEAEFAGEAGRGQEEGPGSRGWVGPAVKTLQYYIHNLQTLIQVFRPACLQWER